MAEKPDTEKKLFFLQEKLRSSGKKDQKTWKELYTLLYNYGKSLTLRKLKTNSIFMSAEEVDKIVFYATSKMIERMCDPDFEIKDSFAGYMNWRIIGELYSRSLEDNHFSLNAITSQDKKEMESYIYYLGFSSISSQLEVNPDYSEGIYKEDLVKSIMKFLYDIKKSIYRTKMRSDYLLYLRFLLGVFLYLSDREKFKIFAKDFLESRVCQLIELFFLDLYSFLKSENH